MINVFLQFIIPNIFLCKTTQPDHSIAKFKETSKNNQIFPEAWLDELCKVKLSVLKNLRELNFINLFLLRMFSLTLT